VENCKSAGGENRALVESGMANRFYVYHLVDPRDGSIFYVGKGSGRRIHDHETEAAKGVHSRKCNRIREIQHDGFHIGKVVVSEHADENEALQAEFDSIAEIGLGNLTNVLPGGAIGAEVYLARLAEAEARRAARSEETFRKGFDQMAPKYAQMFKAKAQTGGYGAYVGDRWIEFGDALEKLFWDTTKKLGFEYVRERMLPHGVEMVKSSAGSKQPEA